MSAYATVKITRSAARKFLTRSVYFPDKLLEDLIDDYLKEKLYNCQIVDDNSEDNSDELLDLD